MTVAGGGSMFLSFLSRLYGAGVALRNAAYDRGMLPAHPAGIPVVSVGNITVGGTGKTPVVELLIRLLSGRGLRVAVVTRGYKRRSRGYLLVSDGKGNIAEAETGGDEPVQIARKFPAAVVIADESRVRGCRRAREEFAAQIVLLDDGFQHRACARDVDIVVVDAHRPLREQRLLPAGRLREPLKNLSRADAVILSRCESQQIRDRMARDIGAFAAAPVIPASYVPERIIRFRDGAAADPEELRGKKALLFSGIGAPASFLRSAEMLGTAPAGRIDFPDHHFYSPADIAEIAAHFRACSAALLLTTEKDAVRLDAHRPLLETLPLYYPQMTVRFLADEDEFLRLLDRKIDRRETISTGTP